MIKKVKVVVAVALAAVMATGVMASATQHAAASPRVIRVEADGFGWDANLIPLG